MTYSLDLHRQENLDHDLLGESEECSLLSRACQGDSSAIDTLVAANQRLVMRLALRYYHSGMAGDHDLMDLVQDGNCGLLKGIFRWDSSFHVRFSTYATWWVRAIMRRGALTQGTSIPRTAREGDLVYMIHKARSILTMRLSRPPTNQEIASQAGLSLNLVTQILPMLHPSLSMDADDDSGYRSVEETLASNYNTADLAEAEIMRQLMLQSLEAIPPNYRTVIVMRYGLHDEPSATYAEIARSLGISRTRVQQIEKQALSHLRGMLQP